jgi:hypothetical protein
MNAQGHMHYRSKGMCEQSQGRPNSSHSSLGIKIHDLVSLLKHESWAVGYQGSITLGVRDFSVESLNNIILVI